MRKKLIFHILVLISCCCFAGFKNDDDSFSILLKKLEDYHQKHPQEKVHLHLDKPYYAIGDDIWFKAYVINSLNSSPTNISNILYVELINEDDSIKKQIQLPIINGFTWGDFKLTDSLTEGNYRIRAYTQWMRNAGPAFFFDKTIKIGNSWANQVFIRTKYTFSEGKDEQITNAELIFNDKTGKPYVNKDVTYVVQVNSKNIFKGKTSTSNTGKINFSFFSPQTDVKSSGKITATIDVSDKDRVTKLIPFTAASAQMDVQFFPEGGNLVDNIPSRIGIKAIDRNGLGKDISGTIVDNEGNEVRSFHTTHLGMGNLILDPQPGKNYTAIVKVEDEPTQKIKLPPALTSGYVLSVNNQDSSKINIKIYLSKNVLGKGRLKLLAQNNGNVYAVYTAQTDKQLVVINIPKKDLPIGIAQLTLFGPDNTPVCERLTFVNNSKDMTSIQLQGNKQQYQKRELVKLALTSGAGNKPMEGNFSLSVTNTAIVQPDEENESHILATFLLTSDLAGYIEKPDYYFLKQDQATQTDLDNLLLTQGWRRFSWKNFLEHTPETVLYAPEKSISISGTLTTPGGKPIEKGKVSLFSKSGGIFMIDTLTDLSGHFNFDHLDFGDSTKFVIQGRTTNNKTNVELKLDRVPQQIVTRNKNTGDIEINVNEAISSYIFKSETYFDQLTKRGLLHRSISLKEVNINEKKPVASHSANLNGAGHANKTITAEELKYGPALSSNLTALIPGIAFPGGQPALARYASRKQMHILVDGVYRELTAGETIDNFMSIEDIESIEVLKSPSYTAIYGGMGDGGILLITTKRGKKEKPEPGSVYTPGIITYMPKGYYSPRTFYSPKYTFTSDIQPDLRSTVYWNPQVITSKEGVAQVEYFNTDQPGIYRVVAEGMNASGQLARTVYTYEVK